MINLSNYEEYFILYMDNELSADEKLMVENFIGQHPHLGEELELLMSTKLPLDEVSFGNKEDLLSSSMKVATVDEALLLYIDNELPASEKKGVEQKIASNKDYALQHTVLMQTKLDASEHIPYPNKKELYRHTERVVSLKGWMRIAAAIVVLLFGSLFFIISNQGPQSINPDTTTTASNPPVQAATPTIKEEQQPSNKLIEESPVAQEQSVAQLPVNKTRETIIREVIPTKKDSREDVAPVQGSETLVAHQDVEKRREVITFDASRFTQETEITADAVVVNKTIAHNAVTSNLPPRITEEDTPEETAGSDGDFKHTKKNSAKGFFRKVSRFIERNTGIGTANSDEQTLIGSVALKLK